MEKELKFKIIRNVAIALFLVVGINALVLATLGFPLMAQLQLKKYWPLLVLLVGGFGTQIGLYTYYKHKNVVCSATSMTSGGISSVSMLLCCSHYLLNVLPFLSLSFASFLTKYTFYILLFGVISNALGIYLLIHKNQQMKCLRLLLFQMHRMQQK